MPDTIGCSPAIATRLKWSFRRLDAVAEVAAQTIGIQEGIPIFAGHHGTPGVPAKSRRLLTRRAMRCNNVKALSGGIARLLSRLTSQAAHAAAAD
jgi:hypothetical protein